MQKAQKENKAAALPRVIAISSGKGGVGKSSIAVNLGISLSRSGAKVCLFDADTGLANANILLGLTPQYSLEHVLYGAKPIEDVLLDGPHGLKIIPGANGISECVNLHPRQQLRLTRELARIESDFDFLLVDTAAGISETTLDFVCAAHHALVVITPEPTSLTDAFSLIKLLKQRSNTVQQHVVVNMCSSASEAKEVFHRFSAAVDKYIGVQIHYLGHILRDESMRAAVVLQNPVAMFPEDDPSCRGFIKLADSLDVITADDTAKRSFSSYWHRQYRQQRTEPDLRADNPGVSEAPAIDPRARDNEYLSELQSRLLLLIAQGQSDEAHLEKLLDEVATAFIQRFDRPPFDILAVIERLLQSPERDDQLLRAIADAVKPWGGFSNSLFTTELLGSQELGFLPDEDLNDEAAGSLPDGPFRDVDDQSRPVFGVAQELQSDKEPQPAKEPQPDNESQPDEELQPENQLQMDKEPQLDKEPLPDGEPETDTDLQLNKAPPPESQAQLPEMDSEASQAPGVTLEFGAGQLPDEVPAVTDTPVIHHYDVQRFGSQESLTDLLRRQRDSDKPLAQLLEALT